MSIAERHRREDQTRGLSHSKQETPDMLRMLAQLKPNRSDGTSTTTGDQIFHRYLGNSEDSEIKYIENTTIKTEIDTTAALAAPVTQTTGEASIAVEPPTPAQQEMFRLFDLTKRGLQMTEQEMAKLAQVQQQVELQQATTKPIDDLSKISQDTPQEASRGTKRNASGSDPMSKRSRSGETSIVDELREISKDLPKRDREQMKKEVDEEIKKYGKKSNEQAEKERIANAQRQGLIPTDTTNSDNKRDNKPEDCDSESEAQRSQQKAIKAAKLLAEVFENQFGLPPTTNPQTENTISQNSKPIEAY